MEKTTVTVFVRSACFASRQSQRIKLPFLFIVLFVVANGCTDPEQDDSSTIEPKLSNTVKQHEETLECSLKDLDARYKHQSEGAAEKVGEIIVGDTVRPMTMFQELISGLSEDRATCFSMVGVSFDYYENSKDWAQELPSHSREIWDSSWKPPRPEPSFVLRVQMKQDFIDGLSVDKPNTPIMSPSAEEFLLLLQSKCAETAPPEGAQHAWISHATMTARSFEEFGTDEFYLYEMRWNLIGEIERRERAK